MKLKFLLPIIIMRIIPIYSAEGVHTSISSEKEYELLVAYAKNLVAPFSEALKELTTNISDPYYTSGFYEKLAKAEKAKFDGEYIDHWENGQLKVKATLKQGIVDGHVHGWYPNGNESFKAYYDNGKKIGIHIAFFPIEICRSKVPGVMGRYLIFNREGKLNGKQFSKSPQGYLKTHVTYKNGVLDGNKIFYTEQGKERESWTYKMGKLISKQETINKTT